MDADDWLKTVEKKLQLVQCNNRENVLLASHQLIGPVADWWDAYVEAHEEPDIINWNELKMVFGSHHVPQGIIKIKKKEFEDLKKGSITHSTQPSCYAPNNMDTDEKKHDCFLNGLNDGLAYALEACDFENFQGMVNKALVLENCRGIMERRRKQERQYQQGNTSRRCIGSSSTRPIFRPAQPQFQQRSQPVGQGYATPQRQVIQQPNMFQTPIAGNQSVQSPQAAPNAGNQSVQRTPATRELTPTKAMTTCFKCGQKGHYTNGCPDRHQQSTSTQAVTPTLNHNAYSVPVTPRQNLARGRVNKVAMVEAQDTQMNGTLLTNSYSILTIP
jgi:hypothetical protein